MMKSKAGVSGSLRQMDEAGRIARIRARSPPRGSGLEYY